MNKIFENYFKQNLKEELEDDNSLGRMTFDEPTQDEFANHPLAGYIMQRLTPFLQGMLDDIEELSGRLKNVETGNTQVTNLSENASSTSYRPPGPVMKKSGYSAGGDRPEVVPIPDTDFPHVNINQGQYIYKWDKGDEENWAAAEDNNQKQNTLKRINDKARAEHIKFKKLLDEFSSAFGNKNADTNVAQAEKDFPAGLPMPPQVAMLQQRYIDFEQIQNNQAAYKKKLQFIASVTPKSNWDKQDTFSADKERFIAQQKASAERSAAAASKRMKRDKVAGTLREESDISTSDREVVELADIVVDEINAVFNDLPEGSPLKNREVALAALEQIKNNLPTMIQGLNVT